MSLMAPPRVFGTGASGAAGEEPPAPVSDRFPRRRHFCRARPGGCPGGQAARGSDKRAPGACQDFISSAAQHGGAEGPAPGNPVFRGEARGAQGPAPGNPVFPGRQVPHWAGAGKGH